MSETSFNNFLIYLNRLEVNLRGAESEIYAIQHSIVMEILGEANLWHSDYYTVINGKKTKGKKDV